VTPQRRPRSGLLTWVLVIDPRSVHWCLARRASLVLVALGLAPLSSLPDPRRRSALVLSRSACLWFHVKQQVGDLITLPAIDVPGVRAHSRLTPDRGGSSPSPLLPSTTHDREASSSGATPTPDLPERRDCSAGPSLHKDPLAGRFARLVRIDSHHDPSDPLPGGTLSSPEVTPYCRSHGRPGIDGSALYVFRVSARSVPSHPPRLVVTRRDSPGAWSLHTTSRSTTGARSRRGRPSFPPVGIALQI